MSDQNAQNLRNKVNSILMRARDENPAYLAVSQQLEQFNTSPAMEAELQKLCNAIGLRNGHSLSQLTTGDRAFLVRNFIDTTGFDHAKPIAEQRLAQLQKLDIGNASKFNKLDESGLRKFIDAGGQYPDANTETLAAYETLVAEKNKAYSRLITSSDHLTVTEFEALKAHSPHLTAEEIAHVEQYLAGKPEKLVTPKETPVVPHVTPETPTPKIEASSVEAEAKILETEVEKAVETAEKSFGKKYGVAIGVGAAAIAAAGYAMHVTNKRKEAESAPREL